MTSSSSDGAPGFLPDDRATIVRLVVVIAFGVAALVGPIIASTSARFSDTDQVGVRFSVPPTPTPTVTP